MSRTALCVDGNLLSGLMGSWSGSSQYQFVWAMRHLLEGAARDIGRIDPGPGALAELHGPVGRLAPAGAPRGGGARA